MDMTSLPLSRRQASGGRPAADRSATLAAAMITNGADSRRVLDHAEEFRRHLG